MGLTRIPYFYIFRIMESKAAVSTLAALAQETRLAIYRHLVQAGPAGVPAGLIAAKLDVPGPTLSFHLKELAHAGLITSDSQGRFLYYRANYAAMNALLAFLTENCCRGSECAGHSVVRVPIPNPASHKTRTASHAAKARRVR